MNKSTILLTDTNKQRVMVVLENISYAQVAEGIPGDPTVLTFTNQYTLYVRETVDQFVQLCGTSKKSTSEGLMVTDWNARPTAVIKESVCYIASDQGKADIRLLCGDLICAREKFAQIVEEW